MVFNNQSRLANAKARYESWIDSLGFNVRHVRWNVTTTAGGSGSTFTAGVNELLPSAGPFSTAGLGEAENVIEMIDDYTEHIVAKRKFHFKGDADIRVKDDLYIKKSGGAWTDPPDTLDDFTYRFQVTEVSEQSGGDTIAGVIVMAVLVANDDMDAYLGRS